MSAESEDSAAPAPADRIVTNARIFTGLSNTPLAESMAIRGEQIVAVGATAEMQGYIGPRTEMVDATGRLVVPGINDAHIHVYWPRQGKRERLVVKGRFPAVMDPPLEHVLEAVKKQVANAKPGTWLSGTVGRKVFDRLKEVRPALDRIAPTTPVTLRGLTGHGAIANAAALKKYGVAEDAPDPVGGWYQRDNGKIIMSHGHMPQHVYNPDPPSNPEAVRIKAFAQHEKSALSFGITSVQGMVNELPDAQRYLAAANPKMRWRLISMVRENFFKRAPRPEPIHSRITVSGHKTLIDGTMLERDAYQLTDYPGKPGWRGRPFFTEAQIRALLDPATGEQPILHVMGSGSMDTVLKIMESTGTASQWRARRVRFEHADYITEGQLDRAKKLGVIICQNPRRLMIPPVFPWVEELRNVDRLRDVLDHGVHLAIGSDGQMNPWSGLMAAATHSVNPSQAITVEQALIAYTQGSAYAEHMETKKGILAPGYLADFVVLSQDIFAIPVKEVATTKAVMTFVGGELVYEAKEAQAATTK